MKKILLLAVLVLMTGCQTTKVWTYNMKQATARGSGDVAMTALLDQGVKKEEAEAFCKAAIKWLEEGKLTKVLLKDKCYELLKKHDRLQYADYLDALFAVIPSDVGYNQELPPEVRTALISFLKDGALHGSGLYREAPPE